MIGKYRAVSILPLFSKHFEKILCASFTSLTDKYNFLLPCQCGFLKNRIAELALLEQKDHTVKQFPNRNLVFCIFRNFSRFFDLVIIIVLFWRKICVVRSA